MLLYDIFFILHIIAGLISLNIAILILKKSRFNNKDRVVKILGIEFIFIIIWIFGSALAMGIFDKSHIYFWEQVKYIGILYISPIWLIFALRWTGKEKKSFGLIYFILLLVSTVFLIFVFTDSIHHLFWSKIEYLSIGSYVVTDVEHGFIWWIMWLYSNFLLIGGTLILLKGIMNLSRLYQKHAIIILIGTLAPWISNLIYSFHLTSFIDLTPIMFVVTGIVYYWGISQFKLIDIFPVARDIIFKNMKDPVAVIDLKNKIVEMNLSMKKILNVSNKNIIGRHVDKIFIKQPIILGKIKDLKTKNCDVIIKDKGKELCYNLQISKLNDKRNNIIGKTISLRDITERLYVEKKLQESEKRFQDVALCSADWIWEVDKYGKYIFVTGNIKKILGYHPSELIGKTPFKLMPEDEAKRVSEIFKDIVSNRKPIIDLENWNISKKGEKILLLTNAIPLFNKNGEFLGYRGVDKDITDKKRIEEERNKAYKKLKILNEDLEERVKERTNEVEKLLKQKNEFINQLGHDLKNPLNPIVNLLPILEKSEPDKKNKEIFDILIKNANYMKILVTKTIDLGRLNSTYTKFFFEDVNLYTEFNNVMTNNEMIFKEKNIQIKNIIPENITVYADKFRIDELIVNLLNNAAKYTKCLGNITLDAKQNNNYITVSIKDSGIGMNKEQLEHVFDEFYKADEARHDFNSSGLGLSICKRIVEIHNGKIWADSKGIGQGSTFYFTIPKNKKIYENSSMEYIYSQIEELYKKNVELKNKKEIYLNEKNNNGR